jgi:thioesterase domain-containing protein
VVADELPLTANGKLDRKALAAVDDSISRSEVDYIAPQDSMELQLARIWERVLGVQPIGVRDNFFDLGGHSLLAVRLFSQIENGFGRSLSLATLFKAPTIKQMASILRRQGCSESWSSLVAIRPGGSKPPLFCAHAAGANVLIYRPLAHHLSPDQPVYALQAQGLDGKTPPFTRVEDIAAHYIKEIRSVQPEGPYYLLGASFGGLVVFEMAQRLRAEGQTIAFLALFDTYCPIHSLRQRISCHIGNLSQRGFHVYFTEAVRAIKNRIKGRIPGNSQANGGGQSEVTTDPLERTVRANLQAEKDYVPASKVYPGNITFFFAEERGAVREYEDNRLMWGKVASGGFEMHVVPGDHITMREEPHVAVLAEKLTACLNRAQALYSARQNG